MLRAAVTAARGRRADALFNIARAGAHSRSLSTPTGTFTAGGQRATGGQQKPAGGQKKSATSVSKAPPASENITVPKQVFGIPGRYASALYTAAAKEKKLDKVEKDLTEVVNVLQQNKQFYNFIHDPTVPRDQRMSVLGPVADKMQLTDITKRFLFLLAENNRLTELQKIAKTFDELMAAARGEIRATVTAADPLTEDKRNKVIQVLKGEIGKDKKLILDEKVDPVIIGGVILSFGERFVDLSVLTRIKRLQQMIVETVI